MMRLVGSRALNKSRVIQLTFVVSLLCWQQSHALVIDYDPDRDAALRECDDLRYANDSASDDCYSALLTASSVLLRADAAAELGDVRTANKYYREAASESDDPIIKTHWGHLYLETMRKSASGGHTSSLPIR